MQTIDNEQIIFCDVDDTLVMWNDKYTQPHEGALPFLDPYDNSINYLTPHKKHINLIKKYKGRKNFIIVHSAGGVKWAESVVKTLKLEKFIDIVMTKSTKFIDDLPCQEWMGTRIYLKD